MSSSLLSVENLQTYFETSEGTVRAVDDISFRVDKGEVVGLVGESGCGKTATALTILRLLPKAARILGGSIRFLGTDLLTLENEQMRKVRGKEISMIFQDPMSFINPVLKVGDQVGEAIRLHLEMNKESAMKQVVDLFRLVQIPAAERVVQYYPHQMSGGMRQRAMIATALACNPSLVIADEPTTALDVTVQAQIIDLIKKLKKELEMSMLLISHDLGVVAELCDRVHIMYAGKIVEIANVFALFEEPKHPYTEGLLRSSMSVAKASRTLFVIRGMVPNLVNPPSGCRFHTRCAKAMEICHEKEPPVFHLEADCRVACWLYSGDGK